MDFSKIRNVKSPSRGTAKSAGIDFYVPSFDEKFEKDFREKNPDIVFIFKTLEEDSSITPWSILLGPGERCLIPSGIKVNVKSDYMLVAFNKSGVATKKGLDALACVVDEDYQGEIHISLVNTNNDKDVEILPGEKIIQFILIPISYDMMNEVPLENLYPEVSERGSGGFGSTGK